jgi:hypothetical protein
LPPDIAALIAVHQQLSYDAEQSASRHCFTAKLRDLCLRAGWTETQIAAEEAIGPLTDDMLARMVQDGIEGRPRRPVPLALLNWQPDPNDKEYKEIVEKMIVRAHRAHAALYTPH